MQEHQYLDKLEHFLLSSAMNDWEPLNVLYAETIDNIPEATLAAVVSGLVKLTNTGLLDCHFVHYKKIPVREHCEPLLQEQLEQHCATRTEQELRAHPSERFGGEYQFYASLKGREEESKDVYNIYYC